MTMRMFFLDSPRLVRAVISLIEARGQKRPQLARERAAAKAPVYEVCSPRAELPKSSRPASERDLVAMHEIHADGLLGELCTLAPT